MNTFKFPVFISILIASFIVSGCFDGNITPDQFSSFAEFNTYFQKQSENFSVKAQDGAVFTAKEGTILEIPANAFVDTEGELVRGEVSILLTEYYKKSDMMFSRLHTVGNGLLLQSGGSLHLDFRVGREQVFSNPDVPMTAFMPLDEDDRDIWDQMRWFRGEMNTSSDLEALNWSLDTVSSVIVVQDSVLQTGETLRAYALIGDLAGWSNCDIFWYVPSEDKGSIKVEVLDREEDAETIVYLFFTGRQALRQLSPFPDGSFAAGSETIPVGLEASIVSVSVGEEETKFGLTNITIEKDGTYELTLNTATSDEIKQAVGDLDD